MPRIYVIVYLLLVTFFISPYAYASYSTHLTGDQAVPPTTSTATGDALFTPNRDNTELKCRVVVKDLYNDGMLQVGLFLGRPGEPAEPDINIANLPITRKIKQGKYDGVLCQVTLTDSNLQGPLAGQKIETLIYAISLGKIFLNISSSTYPEGEIRGQIR